MRGRRLAAWLLAAATCTGAAARTAVTIGDEVIDSGVFDYYYAKNSNRVSGDDMTPSEYLELFINFRLKVHAAYAAGMDRESGFQDEFEGYRNQVAAGYMTDSAAIRSFTREAYEHMLEEVKVSHILIALPAPDDTLDAYNRAVQVRASLTPDNFSATADAVSADPSKHTNHGDIGYITGGMVVYPFEHAAYNTPVGTISAPVRTQFGYHLIYVRDRRPSSGEVLTAHVFKSKPRFASKERLDSLARAVDSLYRLASAPKADFTAIARANSDDAQNASRGGRLPWIGVGRTNPTFEEAVFAMSDTGQVIKIEAPYGWHIVKLLDRRSAPPFEQVKAQLEARVRMDTRSRLVDKSFIDGLKRDYRFRWGTGDTLATFADETLTRAELRDYAREHHCGADSVERFTESALRDYEDRHLEEKYPEFGQLMQEYRDGILLFNISNREIWERAARDTQALADYFTAHIDNYAWPVPHYQGMVVYCADKAAYKEAKKIARNTGEKYLRSTLLNHFNTDGKERVRVEEGVFEPGANAVVDRDVYRDGTAYADDDYPYAFLSEGSYSRYPESYHRVQGMVISDYQDELERQWVKRLKEIYPVTVDEEFRESLK